MNARQTAFLMVLAVASAACGTGPPGFQPLGDLPGRSFHSLARSVSADGSVVVGQGVSGGGYEAFRWSQAGGMVPLGDLPAGIRRNARLPLRGRRW